MKNKSWEDTPEDWDWETWGNDDDDDEDIDIDDYHIY